MSLEQKLERSEELLEVNEQNKQQVEQSRRRLSRAQNQVRAGAARVQNCQNQLQQAVAARNAAIQNASRDEDSPPPDTSSYDAAISRAQAELSAANRELEAARREQLRAESELEQANDKLDRSSKELRKEVDQLDAVAQKYGVELSKTRQLLNTPEGRLAAPLMQSLGAGRERVNDLRRRIAASLGITLAADGIGSGGEGFSGERGILDGLRSLINRGNGNGASLSASPTGGFRRISGSHSQSEDLKKTNPNYSSTDPDSPYNINCQRCVSAYEARRRGFDVEALPTPGGYDVLPIMVHPMGWPSVYKNPQLIDCSAATGEGGMENVLRNMEQWGDDCRAIVRVRWKPECGGGGHVFIAERTGGVTRFIDPQNGEEDAIDYFSLAKGSDLYCMRTDNLEFTDRIQQCCKNTGGNS